MKIIREAGKGIKTIPASQARKDPEGRKVQRAQAIAQGYDGVRYENEEGVEVFHEADHPQQQFEKFCRELEKLSMKYGVVIQSVGGVSIYERGELLHVSYEADASSGDLLPTTKTTPDDD
jgi:hypothetical protein